MDDSAAGRLPIFDCHIQSVDDQGGVLGIVDRPADDLSGERVHDGAAIDFAFSRGMFGDIRNPQFVGREPMELAAHQVVGGGDSVESLDLCRPWEAADTGFTHQDGHQTLAHLKLHTDRQLSMNPARAVGLPGRVMDLADQPGEPHPSHLGGRYRPVLVSVISGTAYAEQSAAQLDPVAGLDEVVDYRVNPFGPGRSSPRSFAAIFNIATSVSS